MTMKMKYLGIIPLAYFLSACDQVTSDNLDESIRSAERNIERYEVLMDVYLNNPSEYSLGANSPIRRRAFDTYLEPAKRTCTRIKDYFADEKNKRNRIRQVREARAVCRRAGIFIPAAEMVNAPPSGFQTI